MRFFWILCVALAAHAQPAPGDDFFAYANSDWLASTAIPPDKAKWGAGAEITAAAGRELVRVIHGAGKAGAPPYAKRVADFYAAYLDEAGIEARGLVPIARDLKAIGAIDGTAALSRYLGAILRADVDPMNLGVYDSPNPFGLAVDYGIHGEKNNSVYLLQGGVGPGARDAAYRDEVARVLEAVGMDRARERADGVVALETALAAVHATPAQSGQETNADHHWAREDFPKNAPGLDWKAFFSAAGLSKWESFVA